MPASQKPARMMLLLHGWTGDETSMWYFARHLPSNYWLVAPRAIFPATPTGYSWRKQDSDFSSKPTIEKFIDSAKAILDLVERWGVANSTDTSQVDLMGFSQGGALAATFAFLFPDKVNKLAVLAGFVPGGAETLCVPLPLTGKTVFVAHGRKDDMISIERGRYSAELLARAGATVNFCESDAGHKVSAECLKSMESYFSGNTP